MKYFILSLSKGLFLLIPTLLFAQAAIIDPANPMMYKPNGADKTVFWCGPGDPEDFLYAGNQRAIINRIITEGANTIYFQSIKSNGGDGGANDNPWNGTPGSGFDDATLDSMQVWFQLLEDANIRIQFQIYDDDADMDGADQNVATRTTIHADELSAIDTLTVRLSQFQNVQWDVSEEYAEELHSERAYAMAETLRAKLGSTWPLAIHQVGHVAGVLNYDFIDSTAINQFAIQTVFLTGIDLDSLHNMLVTEFNESAAASQPWNLNHSESQHTTSGWNGSVPLAGLDTVKAFIHISAMAGCQTVMILRLMGVAADSLYLRACGDAVTFYNKTEYNVLRPNDALGSGDTDYVMANPVLRQYILYANDGSGNLTVSGLPSGFYNIDWLDIGDGSTIEQPFQKVTSNSFTRPGSIGAHCVVSIQPAIRHTGLVRGTVQ